MLLAAAEALLAVELILPALVVVILKTTVVHADLCDINLLLINKIHLSFITYMEINY